MKILVDTSVWSLVLRRNGPCDSGEADELRHLIAGRRVLMIGPIRQELLSGIRDDRDFRRLQQHLGAFPDVVIETGDYVSATQCFNTCRAKGVQGSNTDFLICAVAIRHGFAVLTTDQDFALFAEYLPLRLHRPGWTET